jgi:hypothetical protein
MLFERLVHLISDKIRNCMAMLALRHRAAIGNPAAALYVLDNVPAVEPEPDDRISS